MSLRSYHVLKVLIIALLAVTTLHLNAQSESSNKPYSLSHEETSDLEELIEYKETKRKLLPKKQEKKEEEEEVEEKNSVPFNFGGIGGVLQYLLYLGIIILIVVILVLVFSNIRIEKKLEAIVPLDLEEIEDIETIDAKSGLQIALEAGNYREAVRMLFIQLLQVLVSENSIIWKPKKTNRDYLREMSAHDKVIHFRNLVMAYESVWYGSEEIDRAFFDHLRRDFEKFYSTQDLKLEHGE